jgi:hypothetical protein
LRVVIEARSLIKNVLQVIGGLEVGLNYRGTESDYVIEG